VPFADSDDLVEHVVGQPLTAIFAAGGEPAFRLAEEQAVVQALSTFDGVLALGGGALTWAPTHSAVLDSGVPVVLLRAALATLVVRVGDGHTRPMLAVDPAQRLSTLASDREQVYLDCATFSVDTDTRTPGQVAASIAARLHERQARR
ncbi:MAG: shikimate kinase, partial [Actinomycetota bacterium]|nr:shikimate kinase [Actinomycetota bacterium]